MKTKLYLTTNPTKVNNIKKDNSRALIQESEERYRFLFTENHSIMLILDPETGEISDANSAACNYYGWSHFELCKKKITEINILPDEDVKRGWLKVKEDKQNHFNFKHRLASGELRDVEVYSVPINMNNSIMLYSVVYDITDRKAAEEKLRKSEETFRNLVESLNDVIYEITSDGTIKYVSPVIEKVVGYKPEELIGKNIFSFIYEPDRKSIMERLVTLENRDYSFLEYRCVSKSGKVGWVRTSTIAIIENGIMVGGTGSLTDITERKLAEEALLNKEAALNYAQEIASMGSWDINLITLEFIWSENYYRMLGLTPYEKGITNDSFLNMIHPDDRHIPDDLIKQVTKSKKATCLELRLIMPDGKIKWIQNNIVPVFNGINLVSLKGVSTDITEKKQRDKELMKLSLAVEQSPVSVVITDLDSNIEYVNPAFKTSTGYRSDELIGKKIKIIQSGKTNPSIYNDLWKTITSGKTWHGEWINKKKSGEFYWEIISINPIYDEFGKVTHYLAIKQDITSSKQAETEIRDLNANLELKIEERTLQLATTNSNLLKEIEERIRIENALIESEKSYRTVVENIKEIIFQTDTDGLWIFLNHSWEEITGFSVQESLGQLFLNYVHPEDRQRNMELFTPLLLREKEYCRHQIRYLKKDGGYCWVEVYARLGLNDKDDIIGTYGTINDITERKKSEEEIRKAHLEAEQANMAKSEFLSRMSHELRTPLNSILGFAQLLHMGELIPGQKKGLDHILHSGSHLLNLINEVLDISRIESGLIALSIEPVQMSIVIEEMIDSIQLLAKERQVSVELAASPTNQLYVKSDRQRLKQILLNLLNNAIKYNRFGGTVIVKTELIQDKKIAEVSIRISISDTGLGISPENISKLFTPFERMGAENTETEGSGLGLSVVKKLMEAMSGRFGVDSIPDEGSTFWFELPLSESQLQLIDHDLGHTCLENVQAHKTGVILYIEDNTANIELVEQILANHRPGIRLKTIVKGKMANKTAVEHKPDLILLDLHLSDMHGYDVIRLLKIEKKTKNIPVVVISADGMRQQSQKLLKAGARYYLTKPLEIPKFLKVIDEFTIG